MQPLSGVSAVRGSRWCCTSERDSKPAAGCGRAMPASRQPTSAASMSPASEQVEKISKFFRFLWHVKTLSFFTTFVRWLNRGVIRGAKIPTRKFIGPISQRGADSGIGDFRRAPVRIPRLEAPLALFSLACTDWVGSQYYWAVHTTARWCRQTHRLAQEGACIGRAAVASAALPRRRKNPPRAPDVSQTALASTGWVDTAHCKEANAFSGVDFSTHDAWREDGGGLPGAGLPFPRPPDPSPRSSSIEAAHS